MSAADIASAQSLWGSTPAAKKPTTAQPQVKSPTVVAPPTLPRSNGSTDDSDVVARAGDRRLTSEDIRAFVKTLPAADQAALARDPALFSQTLRILLANQLVLKAAEEKNWDQQPSSRRKSSARRKT